MSVSAQLIAEGIEAIKLTWQSPEGSDVVGYKVYMDRLGDDRYIEEIVPKDTHELSEWPWNRGI